MMAARLSNCHWFTVVHVGAHPLDVVVLIGPHMIIDWEKINALTCVTHQPFIRGRSQCYKFPSIQHSTSNWTWTWTAYTCVPIGTCAVQSWHHPPSAATHRDLCCATVTPPAFTCHPSGPVLCNRDTITRLHLPSIRTCSPRHHAHSPVTHPDLFSAVTLVAIHDVRKP